MAPRNADESSIPTVCVTCGWKPEKTDKWPQGRPVIHCEGTALAYQCTTREPHHCTEPNEYCWSCHEPLGCRICVPGEQLCRSCVVWTRKIEFLRHGPFSNDQISIAQRNGKIAPGADAYPFDWKIEYKPSFPNLTDDQLRASVDAQIKHMAASKRMPHDPTKRQLEQKRNDSVSELTRQHGA